MVYSSTISTLMQFLFLRPQHAVLRNFHTPVSVFYIIYKALSDERFAIPGVGRLDSMTQSRIEGIYWLLDVSVEYANCRNISA